MKSLNGEFGNQYRVGQILPHMAIALREAAEARTVAIAFQRRPNTTGSDRSGDRLYPLVEENHVAAVNREKLFPRIKR